MKSVELTPTLLTLHVDSQNDAQTLGMCTIVTTRNIWHIARRDVINCYCECVMHIRGNHDDVSMHFSVDRKTWCANAYGQWFGPLKVRTTGFKIAHACHAQLSSRAVGPLKVRASGI